ncbi:hypothetical protein [Haloferula sp. BvORR071]|uniref:hypothetical protein n=1 Tax=Haloferula sp. BvORR071 TaxID=1396141 RepID=UPI00055496B0|nr:hypothetical protein [Haloferula sp. BvORR071]
MGTLVLFVVSLTATLGVALLLGQKENPRMPAETVADAPAKSSHREASSYAIILELLRSGNLDKARGELAQLAKRDPQVFFELLEKLPGMPGLEDCIKEAAAGLPWKDIAAAGLLNRIASAEWCDLAWGAYTGARVGVVPDEEVFDVAGRARVATSFSNIRFLLEDAAAKRPREFFDMLNRKGGTSFREEFIELVMKQHPELAGELYASIPDGSRGCNYDRAYVLQVRSRLLPTADNLRDVLDDIGERGTYSSDFAFLFVMQACRGASPEERGKITNFISTQPSLAKNRLLSGMLDFDEKKPMPVEEFTRLVGLYDSGYLQAEALGGWLGSHKELEPTDRDWIEQLPTEKLKLKAAQMLDERAAAAKAK